MLTILGLEANPVAYGTEWAHRMELHRRLRRVIPETPRNPMPHGYSVGSLWDVFPYDFRVSSVECWIDRFRRGGVWIAVPDSPREPITTVDGSMLPKQDALPNYDLYFLATDGTGDILALDHEGEGPWWIPGDAPRQRAQPRKRNPVPTLNPDPGARLEVNETRAASRWVRKALRKRTYFPDYALAASGPAEDSVWNYLQAYSVDIGPGSVASELLARAESLLVWSDRRPGEMWQIPGGLIDWSEWPKLDTNVLEWPQRRWLLSVPAQFLVNGEESWVSPCLAVF